MTMMLYGMVCLGSLLFFLGKSDTGFAEAALRAGGVSLILSVFLGVLTGAVSVP